MILGRSLYLELVFTCEQKGEGQYTKPLSSHMGTGLIGKDNKDCYHTNTNMQRI